MGFLDKFKGKSGDFKDKAAGLATEHSDKIGSGIDKAADLASKATQGKYDDKIGSAADKAKESAEKLGDNKP